MSPLTFFLESIIIEVSHIVPFTLAAVSASRGFSKKIFLIVAISIGLICQFRNITALYINIQDIIEYDMLLTRIFQILNNITFYIALLIFCLKNKIEALQPKTNLRRVSTLEQQIEVIELPPEQALIILKEKLSLGIITEDEYNKQRSKIVNNL